MMSQEVQNKNGSKIFLNIHPSHQNPSKRLSRNNNAEYEDDDNNDDGEYNNNDDEMMMMIML